MFGAHKVNYNTNGLWLVVPSNYGDIGKHTCLLAHNGWVVQEGRSAAALLSLSLDAFDVDLRSLELTAVIDVERFPLRKYIKAGLPGLPVAVAGASRPTER